jgi:oxygen-independent coproporphyrinogen III oxidase
MDPREQAGWIAGADPRKVSPILVQKYATAAPRYTSYPPATHFHPVSSPELLARWRQGNEAKERGELSVYFHIPFCSSLCWFCGCHTFIHQDHSRADRYVGALIAEMDLALRHIDARRKVKQVALGGGSPNYLTEPHLERLLGAFRERFPIQADAELSVELEPRTTDRGQLDTFLKYGFNRFSLGVQDFSPEVLGKIHRPQTEEDVEGIVDHLRSHGCQEINFDLIYGLPGQTLETCRYTVERTLRFRPTRIARYQYAHVPWLKPHQKLLEAAGLPDRNAKQQLAGLAYELLVDAGYIPIGMDHFALPEDRLAQALAQRTLHRNFMGYTTCRGLDQLAFGVSAISAIQGTYSQNEKELEPYYRRVESGELPIERGFLLNRDDEIRRELIIDLFCNFHLDGKQLEQKYGIDFLSYFQPELQRLEPFETDGLLAVAGCNLEVLPEGRYFIRNICMTFDRYLEKEVAGRRYSQAV